MSTEEPTAIDEKKAEEEGTTTDNGNWSDFFKNFGSVIITGILIGVICIGSIGLFLTKVADANILPTDLNAQPYNPLKKRDVPVDLIYMNPVKILGFFGLGFWDEPTSYNIQEANFYNTNGLDFLESFKNTWLCSLLAKSEPEGAFKSAFWTFEYDALKSNLCMSFTSMQKIFYYMNYLPEWATMLLCAIFFILIIFLINFFNFCYSIVSHLSNLPDLFTHVFYPKTLNANASDNHGFDWLFACFWFYVYFILGFWSAILSPFFITLYTFFKALSANYYVRMKEQSDPPQKMNLFNFIKNVFYYKKTFLIILVMLTMISTANQYLRSAYMPGVVMAILILIFGLKILVTDAPTELYDVAKNAVFPSLSQKEVPIINAVINLCSGTAQTPDIIASDTNRIGVTGQSFNVLASAPNTNQAGGKMKGGKGGKPKVKMYNIQLV